MKATEAEIALVRALHRAEFSKVYEVFGDPYTELDGDELKTLVNQWLPLLRNYRLGGEHGLESPSDGS